MSEEYSRWECVLCGFTSLTMEPVVGHLIQEHGYEERAIGNARAAGGFNKDGGDWYENRRVYAVAGQPVIAYQCRFTRAADDPMRLP